MGTPATTSNVYIHIIEDVINKVREDFISNGGPGEGVLQELQGMWEMKMMQAGAILGPIDHSAALKTAPGGGPVHDLNVPYEGPEEYETPTAEMLFPPTPIQTPMPTPLPGTVQTPLPGSVDNSIYKIHSGYSSDYPTPISDAGGSSDPKSGRPSPYMPPPSSWMAQKPPLDVNIAYVEGREEVSLQPHTQDFFMPPSGKRKRDEQPNQYSNGGFVPQQDGPGDIQQLDGPFPDPYEDDMLSTPNIYNYQEVVKEDYNVASTPAPAATPAAVPQNDVGDEEDDEPLNEDDDDEDDLDDVDQGEELNTQHLVLAQFDKVTRAKSRWKCTLKDGIMHINNKDILFNKASGEFEF